MHDEDGQEYGLPDPVREYMERAQADHDRVHIAVDLAKSQVFAFLDSLDPQQLVVLRRILNADTESKENNYFDGLATAYLVLKHNVDSETGLSVEEQLTQ